MSARATVGHEAMATRLAAAGHTVDVEHTGGGVMTIYVHFADGVSVAAGDGDTGVWDWDIETVEDGDILDDGFDLTADALCALVAAQEIVHGGPLRRDNGVN